MTVELPGTHVARSAHPHWTYERYSRLGLVRGNWSWYNKSFGIRGPISSFRNVIHVPSPAELLPFISALKWTEEGLIPAIVQDAENGEVLMMAWMDEPALRDTIATGQTHFYSRSRRAHWHKGATSGHTQQVESISLDCDGDVVLIKAHQKGGACHEGYRSCFFRRVGAHGVLEVASEPVFDAAKVYDSSSDV